MPTAATTATAIPAAVVATLMVVLMVVVTRRRRRRCRCARGPDVRLTHAVLGLVHRASGGREGTPAAGADVAGDRMCGGVDASEGPMRLCNGIKMDEVLAHFVRMVKRKLKNIKNCTKIVYLAYAKRV